MNDKRDKVELILINLVTDPNFIQAAWACLWSDSPDIVGLFGMPQFETTLDEIIAVE